MGRFHEGKTMNPLCLEHCLTESEKQQFEENGFFAVEDAIPQEMVDRLIAAVDRVGAEHLGKDELPADARFNLLDFVRQRRKLHRIA